MLGGVFDDSSGSEVFTQEFALARLLAEVLWEIKLNQQQNRRIEK